jgi:hypothetical protein
MEREEGDGREINQIWERFIPVSSCKATLMFMFAWRDHA